MIGGVTAVNFKITRVIFKDMPLQFNVVLCGCQPSLVPNYCINSSL